MREQRNATNQQRFDYYVEMTALKRNMPVEEVLELAIIEDYRVELGIERYLG